MKRPLHMRELTVDVSGFSDEVPDADEALDADKLHIADGHVRPPHPSKKVPPGGRSFLQSPPRGQRPLHMPQLTVDVGADDATDADKLRIADGHVHHPPRMRTSKLPRGSRPFLETPPRVRRKQHIPPDASKACCSVS